MGDKKKDFAPARILSYGEAAVTQGNVAIQTKVVPPSTSPQPAVEIIAVILIDRRSLVSDGMRTALKRRLDRDLNALGLVKQEPDVLKKLSLRFEIWWESKAPNANQQESYGKWDFPLYFEKAHTSDNFTVAEVLDTLRAHGIRNAGIGASQYRQTEDGWQNENVEGLGVPPLAGYRKVGFLKVDHVWAHTSDVETGFANVLKHELGHMCRLAHSSSGLMVNAVPLNDPKVTFAEADHHAILEELKRLKTRTEALMQRLYEQQTR